jgi:Mg-chelatase subunit ChlD
MRALALCAALFSACGPTCPEIEKIDAVAEPPGLVQVLLAVRCDGAPVTTVTADGVTLTENDTALTGSEGGFVLERSDVALQARTLLLLDVSDSAVQDETLEITRQVALDFATDVIAANQRVAIALFDGAAEIRMFRDWTADLAAVESALAALGPEDQVDPSTNLNGAVIQGIATLDAALAPDVEGELISVGSLVVFTDGVDRAARESDSAARDAVSGSDHAVFVIALAGDDALVSDLEALAKDGLFRAEDPSALEAAFRDLSLALVAESQKYYRLSYCSPLRRPRATLKIALTLGEETDEISFSYPTGDFGPGCALP